MQPRFKLPERRRKQDLTKLSELLRPKTTLDWVLLTFGAIAIIFAGWIGYDQALAPLAVHDTAADFASKLRDIQTFARDQGTVVEVEIHPARPNRASYYQATVRKRSFRKEYFTNGVSAVGRIMLDEQGAPVARTQITFRKGFIHKSVVIDRNGLVSMPD
jgi:hypothetical protein